MLFGAFTFIQFFHFLYLICGDTNQLDGVYASTMHSGQKNLKKKI